MAKKKVKVVEEGVPVRENENTFLLQLILFGGILLFGWLSLATWSRLEAPPRPAEKLSRAEENALLEKWAEFNFLDWNNGQLGASLMGLCLLCWSAIGWKQDKAKMVVTMAIVLAAHAVGRGMGVLSALELAAAAGCIYASVIYYPPKIYNRDKVLFTNSRTARLLFTGMAGVLIALEFLRFTTPEPELEEGQKPSAAVNPLLHAVARLGLAFIAAALTLSSDIHAFRGLLKVALFLLFSAAAPMMGVYTGHMANVIAVSCLVASAAFAAVLSAWPFNLPFVRFYRKWSSMLSGSTEESFGKE